ncbi:MAG: hypothetical protein KA768_05090 [Desulfobulbus sp.]|nr:hypothetical protein [Desulfobulbus sp.]
MELKNPWTEIDADLLVSGALTLDDLEGYWAAPVGDPGEQAACCNCGRDQRVRAYGLCAECFAVADGKTGSELLNALTIFRARVVPVQQVPMGASGPVEFERPKVIGKVEVPTGGAARGGARIGPGRPPKNVQPENEPQPQEREPLRVCDEAGRDLGTLRDLAARMQVAEELNENGGDQPRPAVDRREPAAMIESTATARVRRALVIEVDSAEVEFRCGRDGMDILVNDGEGCVFAAFGLPVDVVTELQALTRWER